MKQIESRIKSTVGDDVNPLSVTGYVEAPLSYDAVWALALALNKTQTRYVQCTNIESSLVWDTSCLAELIYDLINR